MSNHGQLTVRGDVYADDMRRSIQELARATKKTAAQVIFEQTNTMARYLAEWTMPVAGMRKGGVGETVDGGGKDAKKLQENAIAKDIRRAYMSPAKVFEAFTSLAEGDSLKKAFTKATKAGDTNEATRIVRLIPSMKGLEVMMWDGGKHHQAKRMKGYNGRVNQGTRPMVVPRAGDLNKYIKQQQKMAGYTKAGWINASWNITGRVPSKVNKWIWRHRNAPAVGTFKSDGVKSESRLTNNVPWVSKKIDDRRAMEAFDRSMRQSMFEALQAIAKRQQRKT
jgi:hypothetical protein